MIRALHFSGTFRLACVEARNGTEPDCWVNPNGGRGGEEKDEIHGRRERRKEGRGERMKEGRRERRKEGRRERRKAVRAKDRRLDGLDAQPSEALRPTSLHALMENGQDDCVVAGKRLRTTTTTSHESPPPLPPQAQPQERQERLVEKSQQQRQQIAPQQQGNTDRHKGKRGRET